MTVQLKHAVIEIINAIVAFYKQVLMLYRHRTSVKNKLLTLVRASINQRDRRLASKS